MTDTLTAEDIVNAMSPSFRAEMLQTLDAFQGDTPQDMSHSQSFFEGVMKLTKSKPFDKLDTVMRDTIKAIKAGDGMGAPLDEKAVLCRIVEGLQERALFTSRTSARVDLPDVIAL